ncbi:U3 small nucleolar RNA-associated protein 14 like protein C [Dictyocoela muelleri]|nr:U3 small nucleolar RNA-associated protein 14 like protein C [Dictyocoela muelleri]
MTENIKISETEKSLQTNDNEEFLKTIINEQTESSKKENLINRPLYNSIFSKPSLYNHTPTTLLEREIEKVLMKDKEHIQKINREKIFLSEFEKKMARLRRIKSKGYRKLRKKIKERHVLNVKNVKRGDKSTEQKEDVAIPDFLLNELEDKKVMSFNDDDDDDDSSSSQEVMVRKVFDDEFGEEFKKEKEEIVDVKEDIQILPGWGAWGGTGIDVTPNPVNIIKKAENSTKRADLNHHHLILNENQELKIKTKLPKNLNSKEYRAMINIPISKEWNTARIFNKFVKGGGDEKVIENLKYQKRYTK